jgi:hypothetical protein
MRKWMSERDGPAVWMEIGCLFNCYVEEAFLHSRWLLGFSNGGWGLVMVLDMTWLLYAVGGPFILVRIHLSPLAISITQNYALLI